MRNQEEHPKKENLIPVYRIIPDKFTVGYGDLFNIINI